MRKTFCQSAKYFTNAKDTLTMNDTFDVNTYLDTMTHEGTTAERSQAAVWVPREEFLEVVKERQEAKVQDYTFRRPEVPYKTTKGQRRMNPEDVAKLRGGLLV